MSHPISNPTPQKVKPTGKQEKKKRTKKKIKIKMKERKKQRKRVCRCRSVGGQSVAMESLVLRTTWTSVNAPDIIDMRLTIFSSGFAGVFNSGTSAQRLA